MKIDICVCGWYLRQYDEWYAALHRVHHAGKHRVWVVANRDDDYLREFDLPYSIRFNNGLEWGAYNDYLMNLWNGHRGVLFCHDDIEINPIIVDGEIKEPEFIFDQIAASGVDCAYVFSSRHEDVENRGQHGRMVYMGPRFLATAKEQGGFWYDENNRGYTSGEDADLRERYGCHGFNAGINAFDEQRKRIGGDIHRKMYIPVFAFAKRGVSGNEVLHYGQWSERVKAVVEGAADKLHVGCGENHWASHTNVDLHHPAADINADARDLPMADDSYDLVESHHLIEHLAKDDALDALKEWHRVLRPGGHVFLSCPDIVAVWETLRQSEDAAVDAETWDRHMRAVYGQDGPGMRHLYGYSRQSLARALTSAGFKNPVVKTAVGHRPTPSLMALAEK